MPGEVILKGDRALQRKIKRLTEIEERRVVSKTIRKAASPWTKDARKTVKKSTQDSTGHFGKNITTKVKVYARKQVILAMTGARNNPDPATGENPARIAHLLEEDTEPHFIEASKSLLGGRGVLSSLNDPRVDLDTNREPEVFGFRVTHPGTKGLHMFAKAFVRKHREAAQIYQRELAKDIQREAKRGGFSV